MLSSADLNDPKPEKVYSIVRVIQSTEYYQTQAKLWKAEVEKAPQNGDAWYNYYTAARMTNATAREEIYDLTAIVKELNEALPNSFESEFLQFWNGNWGSKEQTHLEKAHQIAPERTEPARDLMALYLMRGEQTKAKAAAKMLYESKEYSEGIVAWSYNQLMSVEEDAILITVGDNDTFFAWMLQLHLGYRTDVTLANTWLLTVKDFQESALRAMDIPLFSKGLSDFGDNNAYRLAIIDHIIKNAKRPLYFGVGGRLEQIDTLKDKLYQTGLAFKYSEASFDNLAMLQNNVENRFLTDNITHQLKADIGQSLVNQMNQQYISPFLMLYKHYKASGEMDKATKLKAKIEVLAAQGPNKASIEEYLNENS